MENQNNSDNLNQNDISFISCTCSKSFCNKKYCECYKQGLNCNSLCRCIECKNKNDDYMQALIALVKKYVENV